MSNSNQRRPEGSLLNSYYLEKKVKCNSFPSIAQQPLESYLIILSVNEGYIKYYFLHLWYE